MKLDDQPIYTVYVPDACLCIPEEDTCVTEGRARAIAATLGRQGYRHVQIVNHVTGEMMWVPAGWGRSVSRRLF